MFMTGVLCTVCGARVYLTLCMTTSFIIIITLLTRAIQL